jgi:hypothetical protein
MNNRNYFIFFAGKTETMTAVADLFPGTAINVTLHGTQLNGEMSYWATLKTFFKDGSSSTRKSAHSFLLSVCKIL